MADSSPYRKKDRDYRLERDHVDLNLDTVLAPAGAPIPDRVCGQCAHYLAGGYCLRNDRREVGPLWTACHHFTTEKQETTMEAPKTTPTTKVCKACGRELPAEAFGRHARSGDGLQPVCRECRSKTEKGNPKYGRPKKDGTVSIPAIHAQEVKEILENRLSKYKDVLATKSEVEVKVMDMMGKGPVVINPSVEEIPDHELAKELRRRGYDVKCSKTIEL